MSIDQIKALKTCTGLLKLLKSSRIEYTATIKYSIHYMITLGTFHENIFINIDLDPSSGYHVRACERTLKGDRYDLFRESNSRITGHGVKALREYLNNEIVPA